MFFLKSKYRGESDLGLYIISVLAYKMALQSTSDYKSCLVAKFVRICEFAVALSTHSATDDIKLYKDHQRGAVGSIPVGQHLQISSYSLTMICTKD